MKKKTILSICTIGLMCILLTGCCLTHDWQEAACTTPETCSECGKTKGEALGHTWQDATCTAAKTCSTCGETEGNALGHTWQEATCTAAKTCSTCGETEGEALGHTWQDATCTVAKTCSVCGETEGEAAGHAWQEANCLTPKTCNVCEETEGDTGDHIWEEATCLAPKTCTICGATAGETVPHNYNESGICTVCGASQKIKLTPDNVNEFFNVTYSVEKDIIYYSKLDYVVASSPSNCKASRKMEGKNWYTITITPTSNDFVIEDAASVSYAAIYTKDNGEKYTHKFSGAVRLETGDRITICEYDSNGSYHLDSIVIYAVNGYCIRK